MKNLSKLTITLIVLTTSSISVSANQLTHTCDYQIKMLNLSLKVYNDNMTKNGRKQATKDKGINVLSIIQNLNTYCDLDDNQKSQATAIINDIRRITFYDWSGRASKISDFTISMHAKLHNPFKNIKSKKIETASKLQDVMNVINGMCQIYTGAVGVIAKNGQQIQELCQYKEALKGFAQGEISMHPEYDTKSLAESTIKTALDAWDEGG